MQRLFLFLIIAGGLVSVGITISFYVAQLNIADIKIEEDTILPGESFEVTTDLDPKINEHGVFVVHIADYKEGAISAKIFDPLGSEIISQTLERNPYQESFEIITSGTYRLLIENSGDTETLGIGAVGYFPSEDVLYLGYGGTVILVIGLIGLALITIYAIKNRRKERFS